MIGIGVYRRPITLIRTAVMNTDANCRLSIQCKCCSWEREFSRQRKFNLEYEDRTFVEFSQSLSDNSHGDDPNMEDDRHNDENLDMSDEVEEGLDDDSCLSDENVVRYFLKEEDDSQQYLDLLEEVGGFCQQTNLRHLQNGTEDNSGTPVAILHEMGSTGHSRPYEGPLAQKQLYEKLKRKVKRRPPFYIECFGSTRTRQLIHGQRFSINSDEISSSSEDEHVKRPPTDSYTEKRLMYCNSFLTLGYLIWDKTNQSPSYVTDLDRWSVLALFATASRSQRPVLIDTVYKHLTCRASIGATFLVSIIDARAYNSMTCITNIDLLAA